MKQKVVAIVGQTATGKSALGITLARHFRGSIISADSRQVYRGLDIGSGKVSKREQRIVPHLLLDVANPRRMYTVAQFVRDAKMAMRTIHQQGRVPIVVGGTGFWLDALLKGTNIPAVPPNPRLRKKLEKQKIAVLYAQLQRLDPQRAQSIDPHNPMRIIRALEIIMTTGKPVPLLTVKARYDVLWLGLRQSVEKLRGLISARLKRRVRAGLVAEVRHLLQQGVPAQRLLDLGLEYRFVTRYLQHDLTREEMLQQLETAIRHYAKRQRTWFVRNPKIHWVKSTRQAAQLTRAFLKS
ncbi:MAG: tRNA (adenosine(37)-N6)-dimethylallyltransferase MiaA [bacterium]|nr:tRNA (adenosine(37)-N6)-dimethylallyltransferase MiaA [bacterium]